MTSSGVPIIAVLCSDSALKSGRPRTSIPGWVKEAVDRRGLVAEPGIEGPVEPRDCLGRRAPGLRVVGGMDVGVAQHHDALGAGPRGGWPSRSRTS